MSRWWPDNVRPTAVHDPLEHLHAFLDLYPPAGFADTCRGRRFRADITVGPFGVLRFLELSDARFRPYRHRFLQILFFQLEVNADDANSVVDSIVADSDADSIVADL